MATSMVKGNPVKLMLSFAFPLLIGNLLQQTYNIIDAAIVGQTLGPEALASVGASSSVQFLVLGFCMGSCTGFSVPVAKYFGAGKLDKMRDYIFNGAALAVLIAAILTTLCSLLCAPILHLLSVPSDIFADAYAYQLVIFLGIPFSILYNYLSSILRAVGDSRTPFLFLAFSAILNIFLDLFCIIILHLGCAGAAIATISAQAISGLLCLFFISRKVKLLLPTKENRTLRKDAVQELLAMGIPTGLQFSITAIGSMVMQSANNGLGSVYVSAFTAAMKIKQFMMCPFDAISTAASVFCSQNLGAGQSKRIRQGLLPGCACRCRLWCVCRCHHDSVRTAADKALYCQLCFRSNQRFGKISALPRIFLLDAWYFECLPYGNAGTWLLGKSRFLRRNGDAGTNDCLPGIWSVRLVSPQSALRIRLRGSPPAAISHRHVCTA